MLTRHRHNGPVTDPFARTVSLSAGFAQRHAAPTWHRQGTLSDDVPVSGPSSSDGNGRVEIPEDGSGVLANLPRTRPQRATARRAASRRAGAKAAVSTPEKPATKPARKRTGATSDRAKAAKPAARRERPRPETTAQAPTAKPRTAKRPSRAAARPVKDAQVLEPAPRQGYECLEERATGPVTPPGGADLLNTAAEALGELAKAGLSNGERLLREVFSLFPR